MVSANFSSLAYSIEDVLYCSSISKQNKANKVSRCPGWQRVAISAKHEMIYMPANQANPTNTPFTPYTEKKGEEYMNSAQLEHFRAILLSWKKELMEEVDRTVHHMKEDASNYADPSDRATQEEEFSLELRTRDRERKLIKKIDKTLDRIKDDDYGFCDSCGVEIGVRRLEARPTATLCIDCKTLAEIKERQTGI